MIIKANIPVGDVGFWDTIKSAATSFSDLLTRIDAERTGIIEYAKINHPSLKEPQTFFLNQQLNLLNVNRSYQGHWASDGKGLAPLHRELKSFLKCAESALEVHRRVLPTGVEHLTVDAKSDLFFVNRYTVNAREAEIKKYLEDLKHFRGLLEAAEKRPRKGQRRVAFPEHDGDEDD